METNIKSYLHSQKIAKTSPKTWKIRLLLIHSDKNENVRLLASAESTCLKFEYQATTVEVSDFEQTPTPIITSTSDTKIITDGSRGENFTLLLRFNIRIIIIATVIFMIKILYKHFKG
jgi:hypothetical protein